LQPASSFFWKGLGSAVCGTADCWCGCGGRKQRFRDLSCETGPLCAFVTPQAVALLVVNTAFGFLQWNIRLVPHYWLGVFFVLTHLAAGARVIIMAHGVSKAFADRFMVGGGVVAGIVATVIMLGMCGVRLQFK
jgi:hypothetical protein